MTRSVKYMSVTGIGIDSEADVRSSDLGNIIGLGAHQTLIPCNQMSGKRSGPEQNKKKTEGRASRLQSKCIASKKVEHHRLWSNSSLHFISDRDRAKEMCLSRRARSLYEKNLENPLFIGVSCGLMWQAVWQMITALNGIERISNQVRTV